MEELFKQAVARNEAARKTSVPWQPDVPYPQAYYAYNAAAGQWEAQQPSSHTSSSSAPSAPPSDLQGGGQTGTSSSPSSSPAGHISKIALYAWNVDFMLPFAEARMTAALGHLETLISPTLSAAAAAAAAQTPTGGGRGVVIFLQECTEPDLLTIAGNPWVRDNFVVTDLDNANWASGYYGTTTLVDRKLAAAAGLAACFRVHYSKTRMERDVLFVDIDITAKILRVGNTHLESMALEPAYRPPQVELAARYMKGGDGAAGTEADKTVHAALLAGDFNAVQEFDRTLHADNGLKDAYIELGGKEDTQDGYTWGQQAATVLRERYGCSRMDKVYFHGNGLQLNKFERFGADVELQDEEQRRELVDLGFDKPWITDHLGVVAEFDIVD
ncbi:uncharacterized protein B0I36DRAFT_235191 [Microdochium trichocladiopsis]|uniref:Endonuclease/exonuclease/phosphatase domain-containing protein n=1 Tax=Microdochium trichocladiopsis TaxID=1682393 RepID=A0A9P8YHP0_9PEZI|nr:uncharacterized protein B0I36DRAFT_235191 [Microdochium trichocladiopsis]KAH7040701.1 hypothetical protein B0I36DRAFT_235191 [Microdochium trichocladiopsis]